MIAITVNGEMQQIEEKTSLGELIRKLELNPKTMAVLLNDAIVDRNRFDETCLAQDDIVELVRFLPGG